MSEKLIIEAKGLFLSRGNGQRPLNLKLMAGQSALVLIRNLDYLRLLMKCCLGLEKPEGGSVSWREPHAPDLEGSWATYDFYRRIGYVDRQSQLLGATRLRDHFILFSRYARQEDIIEESERLLTLFKLEPYLDYKADDLPEPQRRLALYALALCRRPDLLLIERPVQFLDRDFQLVWNLILNERAGGEMACVVFERGRSAYASESFDYVINLDKEAGS